VKVVIHDRTCELPARLRGYAEKKLVRLSRHFDRVLEAEVDVDHLSKRSQEPAREVQIVVRLDGRKHPVARARERGPDAQAALDLALDKIDRQVVKLKEKIKVEKKRPAGPAPLEALEAGAEEREPGLERIRMKLRPESLDDVEEALNADGKVFHVFLDEDSGEVHVAYRRRNGNLAVIEPVVT
jgi:putative sigma-54 modulation protein